MFIPWLVTHSSSSHATVEKEEQSHTAKQQHFDRSPDAAEITSIQEEQAAVRSAHRGESQHEEQAGHMALTDAHQQMPQQVSESAQPTQARRESPFLGILMERGMAVVVARELLREKEEKAELQRQRSRESYYRQKQADPDGLREKERVRKAW